MIEQQPQSTKPAEKLTVGLLYAGIGSLITIVFSQYRPLLSESYDLLGRIGLLLILLIFTLLARRHPILHRYWRLLFGMLITLTAISLDWWIARFMQGPLGLVATTPAGLAFEKLRSGIIVISVILVFTKLSGDSLGSIYVQKGKLKAGLIFGLVAFAIAAIGAIPMSKIMFTDTQITLGQIVNWAPWILLFVLANAANEELLFRGLFLRKLEPFFGKTLSNILIVLVFTVLHLGATYTKDQVFFLVILVPLALAWGYVMQKTESVWGSILFHAGMDIPIIISIFSAM
ncbi:CPBP family intramembrane glutamic endopeptidase [Chloroflexota bacterium]